MDKFILKSFDELFNSITVFFEFLLDSKTFYFMLPFVISFVSFLIFELIKIAKSVVFK